MDEFMDEFKERTIYLKVYPYNYCKNCNFNHKETNFCRATASYFGFQKCKSLTIPESKLLNILNFIDETYFDIMPIKIHSGSKACRPIPGNKCKYFSSGFMPNQCKLFNKICTSNLRLRECINAEILLEDL